MTILPCGILPNGDVVIYMYKNFTEPDVIYHKPRNVNTMPKKQHRLPAAYRRADDIYSQSHVVCIPEDAQLCQKEEKSMFSEDRS